MDTWDVLYFAELKYLRTIFNSSMSFTSNLSEKPLVYTIQEYLRIQLVLISSRAALVQATILLDGLLQAS